MKPNFNPKEIKLVVGLGNPGEKYSETYHNTGKSFVCFLAENQKFQAVSKKNFSYFKKNGVVVVKSEEFMNRSGTAVREAVEYFEVNPEEIAVAHDDSDIQSGKFKLSFGRGAAGHKGVISIIRHLGTKKFWRIRIGIRNPNKKIEAEKFVLKKMSKEDEGEIKIAFQEAKEVLKLSYPE